jgi:hypothetical protein
MAKATAAKKPRFKPAAMIAIAQKMAAITVKASAARVLSHMDELVRAEGSQASYSGHETRRGY